MTTATKQPVSAALDPPVRGVVVGDAPVRLWGMTSRQRLQKAFPRAGVVGDAAAPGVLLTRADWVYDESLIQALARREGALLVRDGQALAARVGADRAAEVEDALARHVPAADPAFAGLAQLGPVDLAGAYNHALRKREDPLLEPLAGATVRHIESRLFGASYKGVTDLVTKYAWPVPARIVTRWCSQLGVPPNAVTFVGLLLTVAAFFLFWRGQFALGLLCAWGMTFLDTVDGKLARVTLTSSKFGDRFDHGLDLIHPPFWWWAWVAGAQMSDEPVSRALILAIVIGGYVAQRAEEGIFVGLYKIQMHVWKPFDSWFRLITARRNPNLLILTAGALLGRPDLGMVVVAVWTVICFAVHALRIVQAWLESRRGPVLSWLNA